MEGDHMRDLFDHDAELVVIPVIGEPILQFFNFDHLPEHLQDISAPFGELALSICAMLPKNPERSVALRRLLEAKDAAVRAKLYEEDEK